MGGLFSKRKAPAPDPAQEERIVRQEQKAESDERDARRRMLARIRARSAGGPYMMMAPGVFGEDLPENQRSVLNSSLGSGRNPRG